MTVEAVCMMVADGSPARLDRLDRLLDLAEEEFSGRHVDMKAGILP